MLTSDVPQEQSPNSNVTDFSSKVFWESRAARAGLSLKMPEDREIVTSSDREVCLSSSDLNVRVSSQTEHELPGLLTAIMTKTPIKETGVSDTGFSGPLTALMLATSSEECEFASAFAQHHHMADLPCGFGQPDHLPPSLGAPTDMLNSNDLSGQSISYNSVHSDVGDFSKSLTFSREDFFHEPGHTGQNPLFHESLNLKRGGAARPRREFTVEAMQEISTRNVNAEFIATAVRDTDKAFITQATTFHAVKYLEVLALKRKKKKGKKKFNIKTIGMFKKHGPSRWELYLQERLEGSEIQESESNVCPFDGCIFNQFGLPAAEDLKKHVLSSHWITRHCCVWCSQEFSRSDAVVRHVRNSHCELERISIMKSRVRRLLQLIRLGLAIGSTKLDYAIMGSVMQTLTMHKGEVERPRGWAYEYDSDEEKSSVPVMREIGARQDISQSEVVASPPWQGFRDEEMAQNVNLNAALATNTLKDHISDLFCGSSDHWIENCENLMQHTGNQPRFSALKRMMQANLRARRLEAERTLLDVINKSKYSRL